MSAILFIMIAVFVAVGVSSESGIETAEVGSTVTIGEPSTYAPTVGAQSSATSAVSTIGPHSSVMEVVAYNSEVERATFNRYHGFPLETSWIEGAKLLKNVQREAAARAVGLPAGASWSQITAEQERRQKKS